MYKKFTTQEKEDIKILYKEGLTIRQISDRCQGRSCASIYELVKRIGLITSSQTWTYEEVKILREHYGTGIQLNILLSMLNRKTHKAINQKAAAMGLKGEFACRKHSVDAKFWDVPNPINSYWAGFMAADGCLLENGSSQTLACQLAIIDKSHLELFAKHCFSSHPVREVKPDGFPGATGTAQLQISCPFWKESFEKIWAITPRKTQTLSLPNLPDNLMDYWLAGFVDGDGCYSTFGNRFSCSLCCMDDRPLEFFRNWINKRFLDPKRIKPQSRVIGNSRNKLRTFTRVGEEAVRTAHHLMSLPCPHLRRKYEKVKAYLDSHSKYNLYLPPYDEHLASLAI